MPGMVGPMLRYTLRLPVPAPYKLRDMADDAVGVLDALGIPAAHVCGASMGGMIAQQMAVRHPQRVKSLTLIMTTSGARHLPQPSLRVRQALLAKPRSNAVADVVAHLEALVHTIGSPGYRPDAARLARSAVGGRAAPSTSSLGAQPPTTPGLSWGSLSG